jgi:hypothetical protein
MMFLNFFVILQTHFWRLTAHHQCLLQLFESFHIRALNPGHDWQFDHVEVFVGAFAFVIFVFGSLKDRIELGFLFF